MDLFSKNGNFPAEVTQFRVRLPDGLTRTDPRQYTQDEEVMALLGYVKAPPKPEFDPALQIISWNGADWVLSDIEPEPIVIPEPEPEYAISAIESVIGSTDSDSVALI